MIYQELIDASRLYADRNDIEVDNSIETFVIMTEARINRVLKTRKQSARAYSPTVDDQEYYSLPIDYAGMRDIQLNSAIPSLDHRTCPFIMLTPQLFNVKRNEPYDGTLYYSIIGNQIQIHPKQVAGKSIEITYFQKVPALNASAPANWMSVDHPDIYLAGITSEIELFAKNYEVATGWQKRMSIAINELDNSDIVERWSGTPLVVRMG